MIVRPAAAVDHAVLVRLFPELGVPDPVPSRDRYIDSIAPDALVAVGGEDVLGIVWARQRGDVLHVVYLITDPLCRRRGIGMALMEAAAARGRALGLEQWMLNVKPDNAAARALYAKCGMVTVMESASMRLTWDSVARLPASPAGTTVNPLQDDGPFEAALGMGHGELAAMRALPGRVFFGAVHENVPVGVIGFDAAFPGASPFRFRAPVYARALLEAVRPLARPGDVALHAFVEGDPPLEAALAAVGAVANLRTLRLAGPLPSA
jgi:GNAT superfamily N-acetyltransferase